VKQLIKNFTGSPLANSLFFKECVDQEKCIRFVHIDPNFVKSLSGFSASATFITGTDANYGVYGGGWDRFKRSSRNYFMYDTVSELLNGADVRETAKYRKLEGKIDSEEAFSNTEKIIGLIDTLKEDGYLSQYELGNVKDTRVMGPFLIPRNEIVVGLGRDGNFIRLKGGRHRLAIAQQIGIKSIPAILTIVHKKAVNKLPEKQRIITGKPEDFRPF
jgi:hypothetical protein